MRQTPANERDAHTNQRTPVRCVLGAVFALCKSLPIETGVTNPQKRINGNETHEFLMNDSNDSVFLERAPTNNIIDSGTDTQHTGKMRTMRNRCDDLKKS